VLLVIGKHCLDLWLSFLGSEIRNGVCYAGLSFFIFIFYLSVNIALHRG